MKPFVSIFVVIGSLVSATPTSRDVVDTSYEMDETIRGSRPCAAVAVNFARGTFDSGNIGVWVGPQFKEALLENLGGDIAFQGVNPAQYPAVLDDYAKEGGSESCGTGLAKTVDAYAAKCPEAAIVVAGWSQGALCAHKAVNRIGKTAMKQLKALVTFGDPNEISDNLSVPSSISFKNWCVDDTVSPDPLCTKTLTSGFKLPRTLEELQNLILEPLRTLPDFATGVEQTKQAAGLLPKMIKGLVKTSPYFLADVLKGRVQRWMVLPQHFIYANNGMAKEAAQWVAGQV
ncbi:carbohydrate esterase family 5 protein [Massariosphaeria phaeospora]|uniref:cutinase n=1 Tax=Massariosphaeria phaeospora TaxID=100035 RepID=A0A7C8I4J9_9PLEO|nr:carbohydrate esterase family 5 protein [Massariosphaeria phaeospora]